MRRALAVGLLAAALWCPAAAFAQHDPTGHPLRIVGYLVHPVGVILDWMIFKPAYWIGSHEPLRTLFGVPVPDVEELPPPAEPEPAGPPAAPAP